MRNVHSDDGSESRRMRPERATDQSSDQDGRQEPEEQARQQRSLHQKEVVVDDSGQRRDDELPQRVIAVGLVDAVERRSLPAAQPTPDLEVVEGIIRDPDDHPVPGSDGDVHGLSDVGNDDHRPQHGECRRPGPRAATIVACDESTDGHTIA